MQNGNNNGVNTVDLELSESGCVDEEMSTTERELAEDAQWKRIQQNTFTRWANEHLKHAQKYIGNLETDLSDGLRLVALIEVLANQKLPKHNKKPNFRSQKLENVSVALTFLEKHENIRIVNIDSTDIVDCKLKLILGLIWTLILHYSISLPQWDGEQELGPGEKGPTPKQRLFQYIQSHVPDIPISNFTSDWNDGRAVGALVDNVAPGLCPDWPAWVPSDSLQNATEAMNLADDWLGVPQLITPEEMVNPNCDELSMMTYLSQFPNAKLKPGAPLRPQTNPGKVRCYGPGVERTGLLVGGVTHFTIETFNAGKGNVEAFLQGPDGRAKQLDCEFKNDRTLSYTANYTPEVEGDHIVTVKFSGCEIPRSPFKVQVKGFAGDANKVTASGPGLEPSGVVVNKPTFFDIISKDAGQGTPEVVILDPTGHKNSVPVKIKETSKGVHRSEYVTSSLGLHSVNVFFAGKSIPGSPFGVKVSPASDVRHVKVSGRGVQPVGIRVGDEVDFQVVTEGAGDGNVGVRIIGPGGVTEPVRPRKLDEYTTEFTYNPKKEGKYAIIITYGDQELPKSPYEVQVGPKKHTNIKVFGPGLKGGIVGYPARFTVDTNGETGGLGFSIEGPSKADIKCNDLEDGSADVSYYPTAVGEYALHILCENEDIPGSPFMIDILPKMDYYPEKVICSGPGLEKNGILVGEETSFAVDTSKAGDAPLDVKVLTSPRYSDVVLRSHDDGRGRYNFSYTPTIASKHLVQVNYGGVAVEDSPFRVLVSQPSNPSAVKVFGAGVNPGVKTGIPSVFHIDCKNAGSGDIKIALTDPKGRDVPLDIEDNQDGTFTVEYSPSSPGKHRVTVLYGDEELPQSPITVDVQPSVDVSKVRVEGLNTSVLTDAPTDFIVDTRPLGLRDDEELLRCKIKSPSGLLKDYYKEPLDNGAYKVSYTPTEEGQHTVDVCYDGLSLPGCPFSVNASEGCDVSKCRAFGPGLQKGVVDEQNTFTVETKGAGPGSLGIAILGPSEAKMNCHDNCDGSCTVDYVPFQPGEYEIGVKFGQENIPGSPFKVNVHSTIGSENVNVWGNGIQPSKIRANNRMKFQVDASKAEKLPVHVDIKANGKPLRPPPDVKSDSIGIYDVTYVAPPEGADLSTKVTLGGEDVPGSPFESRVRPSVDPERVRLSGLGVAPMGVPASLPVEFVVDASDAGQADLKVDIQGPDGRPCDVKISDKGDETFIASYLPDDCGKYKVNVNYGGQDVTPSPLPVQVQAIGKADKCQILEGVTKCVSTGEEYCISVNTEKAEEGALTCRLRSSLGTDQDVEVEDCGNDHYNVYYSVKEPDDYSLCLKYGGQTVPGGFYSFTAYEKGDFPDNKKVNGFHHNQPSQRVSAEVDSEFRPLELHNVSLPATGGEVTAEVKMPSGKKENPLISDNRDGTVSLKYDPKEEGLHELLVKYNGQHVQGSPFKFHVDSISSGYVTAYGSGLVHGVSGEPCLFTVSTKNAGSGGLSLAVEGPSKAEISCHDNKDGTVSVNYLPISPGEYKVSVKFADKHVRGSPYSVKVTGEGRKRSQISMGNQSEVSFPGKVDEKEFKTLNASIKSPSGLEEPCFLKKLASGQLGISFTPREIGQHLVSIKKLGYHINGSPFKANVSAKEVGDASKVKITGKGLVEGTSHHDNEFQIDTREAGFGGLSLSIEGPSKAEIKCKDKEDGVLGITYKPTEPGYYIANLKFADHHVRGSPFTIKVTGEGSNRIREKIQRQRDAAPMAEVGARCRLTVKLPGVTTFDLSSSVMSPGGTIDAADMSEIEPGLFGVSFTPKESGVHTISVKFQDGHIPGSPFRFTVGALKDGGSHRVHCGGPGLERGEVNAANEFNVWTREAGAGNLAISVEGPSKALIDFKDRGDGSCGVSYKVAESGDYRIGIKFNDKHVPESPFRVYVTPELGEARKIEIGQFPEQGSLANKAFNFLILRNGASKSGHIDLKIVGPDGKEDDCFMDKFDDDIHSVRCVPRENGIHFIHVKFNGIHIPGSPFRLRIGKDDADPAAVEATGIGLVDATSGQKMDFLVNTCNAGKGTLAVTIDGPTKVAMDCTEAEEGYKVRYTPLAPGDYYIGIKFNGHHIADSPYKVKCTGEAISDKSTIQESSSVVVETVDKSGQGKAHQVSVMPHFTSDVTKVTCKGLGLKKAHLNRANNFTIDASNAGSNVLYVGMFGPKSPVEELHIKHTGYSNYSVSYQVVDPGEYILGVKWGDHHVPGSPFFISA